MRRLDDFEVLEVNGSVGIRLHDDDRFVRLAATDVLKQRVDGDIAAHIP